MSACLFELGPGLMLSVSSLCVYPVVGQHPFISQAKPVTILRDLITEAMEMKAKRQQEQQRELEEEDDNSVRILKAQSYVEAV